MELELEEQLALKIAAHLERQVIINEEERETAKRFYMMKNYIEMEYLEKETFA